MELIAVGAQHQIIGQEESALVLVPGPNLPSRQREGLAKYITWLPAVPDLSARMAGIL
jgi:hypothetical protein